MTPTVDALRRWGCQRLAAHSDSPDLDARLLLEHVLGVNHSWLVIHARDTVDPPTQSRFDALLARRASGEPIAYITGTVGFWTLNLEVTPDVLIPRPDTETIVEVVLERHGSAPCKLLDLGTGSGAIALALASERPHWGITATDASDGALACAQKNALRLDLANVQFAAGSWYAAVGENRFDVIVSNPPYIAPGDAHLNAPELGHEPGTALVSAAQGLADLEHIVDRAPEHLNRGGALYLEHGADQGPAVRAMLDGWSGVTTVRDLGNNDRVTFARLEGRHELPTTS